MLNVTCETNANGEHNTITPSLVQIIPTVMKERGFMHAVDKAGFKT